MDGDDGTSANIEALQNAISEAQAKADAGDGMFLVRANYLREKLASLTTPTQQPEAAALPQSVRMAALNTSHTEAKGKTKSEGKSTQKNLGGSTQVTVVYSKVEYAPDVVPQLAGASPHAPHPPKRVKRTREGTKDAFLRFRLPADMKAAFEAKCAVTESDLSANARALIAAYLSIPLDEAALQRSRMLGDEIAALTVALNRQGNNFNQISKSAHEGKPCALSRPEISQTLQQHTAAVSAILKLGFAS